MREGWRKVGGVPLIVVNTERHEEGVIKLHVYRKQVGKMEEEGFNRCAKVLYMCVCVCMCV